MRSFAFGAFVSIVAPVLACEGHHSCYGPLKDDVVLTRNVRRMQPDAQNATTTPKAPLEWGQINFMHTTDTHGWLEGHIKEQNYGADWGDYVSFTKHMKQKARSLGVDLLLVDTGDLHDGAGLSDATSPNGNVSNVIFENVDYDLLTIGNHELYVTEIAYETFSNFSKVYGDKYLTSNVQIINPATGQFEYIGSRYRYFTTEQGLRIMAFGVLFDFTGNSNVSKVIKAADMVKQPWFQQAVNYTEPIDLFVITGHNPVRTSVSSSTMGTVFKAIRSIKPDVPIQAFGGHTHIRDFAVYDNKATGLESGRYCETLGWLAMSGIESKTCKAQHNPKGVPNPTRSAVVPASTGTASASAHLPTSSSNSTIRYARRYLDWNRNTFAYHAENSQPYTTFDTSAGTSISAEITSDRSKLNLTDLYGCAPETYCQYCKPFLAEGNIFGLLQTALATVVVNETRKDVPRLIIINTGSVRFDLAKGPFTYDDSFIVSPFDDAFQFIPDVPYEQASQVLGILNAGAFQKKKRDLETADFGFSPILADRDTCLDPPLTHHYEGVTRRSKQGGRLIRRQSTAPNPGYTTKDDFGTDGDDTIHSAIPDYSQPNDLQANGSFPLDGSMPKTVDLVFLDFIASYIVNALNQPDVGGDFSLSQVSYYMDKSFTTNSYLPAYAKIAWQANVPNCPVGEGIGAS
ncbi:Secreted protein [Alternaria tenuissima]|uniref:Secreted protein n=2 Tax=Alternaria alternata complex TaxID=187734 RepID=A0A4Q4NL72_ALTAL|nr:calcineurin-like phosphoesterase [Alternaria alternata]RYN37496.1 Secreted protein [Alternaria tenuissima]RYN46816.1 Secreted protein [Alternaria tenuissima]RYN77410.1 Secreted protein [Alternaria alternata]RYN99073.1 Secreted protein [Alternaria tenuissima]